MTSSTAFSLRRSENLKALISACASPNSRSLSAKSTQESSTTKRDKLIDRKYIRIPPKNTGSSRIRTSDFILQPIQLNFHRIRPVQKVYELIRIQAGAHRRPPPGTPLPLLEGLRYRQRRSGYHIHRLIRRRPATIASVLAVAQLHRRNTRYVAGNLGHDGSGKVLHIRVHRNLKFRDRKSSRAANQGDFREIK